MTEVNVYPERGQGAGKTGFVPEPGLRARDDSRVLGRYESANKRQWTQILPIYVC